MRPDCVEADPPTLDQHLCLMQRVEHLTLQQFVRQLRVEALDIAVLPPRAQKFELFCERGVVRTCFDSSGDLSPALAMDTYRIGAAALFDCT